MRATVALARWQSSCQGAATPATRAGAPTGSSPLREPCNRSPLRASRCKRLCSRAVVTLRAGHRRSCPRATLLPLQAAATPCGCRWPPFQAGHGRDLDVGDRPYMGIGRGWPPLLITAFIAKM
ncbi:hypothetical protein B296_00056490 [Ensete ventricosum]|uniref:Uncharacterized protein n=1 Tax=Ensete ventricosum TaxID=4639 RepID=A0A426WWS4_ENSVE|nr:hypothetical protein B296_00056490 [Ensete ventricosum]